MGQNIVERAGLRYRGSSSRSFGDIPSVVRFLYADQMIGYHFGCRNFFGGLSARMISARSWGWVPRMAHTRAKPLYRQVMITTTTKTHGLDN